MDVDAAARHRLEHCQRQDLAVRDHDGELGARAAQRVAQLAGPRRAGLDHRQAERLRGERDRRRRQLAAAPGRLVGLRYHQRDVVPGVQRAQAWHGELGGSQEGHAHADDLSPAVRAVA